MASQEINTYPTEEPQKPSVPNRPTGTEPTTKPTTSRPWKPTTITTITTSTTTTTQEPATEENTWTFKPTTGKPTTEDPWAWKPTTTTAATLPTTQSNYHLTGNSGLNYNKKTALHCFFFFLFSAFQDNTKSSVISPTGHGTDPRPANFSPKTRIQICVRTWCTASRL